MLPQSTTKGKGKWGEFNAEVTNMLYETGVVRAGHITDRDVLKFVGTR